MTAHGWLSASGPMKVPANINVVRFTGFSGGAFVETPRGFVLAEVRGDCRRYAVREGYRLESCPGDIHRGLPGLTCPLCAPMWGVVAVKIPGDGAVLPEHRAKSSGRLATDFERMAREGRCARAAETIEESFPGFGKAWKRASKREDRSTREKLSRMRDKGLIGRKS